ncbi:MAG: hypothetical protein AAGF11_03330 [Myxococcota bacterium]
MTTRSILLGCLGSVWLLGGCIFEDSIPPAVPSGSGDSTATIGGSMTSVMESSTGMAATIGSMTAGTTTMSLDTTADATTSDESADSTSTGPVDPCIEACAMLVCGMEGMCNCGECSNPEATCSEQQTYCGIPIGADTPLPFEASILAGFQLGHPYEVLQPRVVRRLGVNAWGGGTDIRLALYDDDGSGPANLLAETGSPVELYTDGPNEWEVGATPINEGIYWVMLHTGASTPIRRGLTGELNAVRALRNNVPFDEGFPPVMDDEMVAMDYQYNIYMVVED